MKKKLFFMAMMLLAAISLHATVRYVTVLGTGDGLSWETASGDLQAMIDASDVGDEVWIQAGVYHPEIKAISNKPRSKVFFLKSGVSLYGGFAGNENSKEERVKKVDGKAWEWEHVTVISADDETPDVWIREIDAGSSSRYSWKISGNENNFYHCLFSKEQLLDRTVVDGLVFKGGNADYHKPYAGGAAVYAMGWLEMYNCIFTENHSKFKLEGTKNFHGGAVTCLAVEGLEGKARIEHCLFKDNMTSGSYNASYGGGVYIENGTVKNCEFEGCVSLDAAGGIYACKSIVEDCRFFDCYGGTGGGIYNEEGYVSRIEVVGCRALLGGGVCNNGDLSYAHIVNCYADSEDFGDLGGKGGGIFNLSGIVLGSVVFNCTSFDGGGIFVMNGRVVNCTVQHNAVRNSLSSENIQLKDGLMEVDVVYNTIGASDVSVSNFRKASDFFGWTTDDSKKRMLLESSWELVEGSLFIDSGKLTEGVEEKVDIAGNPRITGSSIDVGAYEYVGTEQPEGMIVLVFEDKKQVTFGTGGGDGTSFSVDWGDGERKKYEGAQLVTGIPEDKTVIIYGDNLQLLKAYNVGLVALDITKAPLLGQIQVGMNKLKELDVTHNALLTGLYCEQNGIQKLDVKNLSHLRVLDCSMNEIGGMLDCSAMEQLTKLTCSNNKLSEIKVPVTKKLLDVECNMNLLTELDVTDLQNLESLSCSGNELTSMDLSKNLKLKELYCSDNYLKTLDMQYNVLIENISASENELTHIDLSKNIAVKGLYLQNNKLQSLEVSTCPEISWLNVENNALQNLDVTNLSDLRLLNVAQNNLVELDLLHNPLLNTLRVENNQLKELNLATLKSLVWLVCSSNQLEQLDLKNNSMMAWLECADNKITKLEVSHLLSLQKLQAGNNLLCSLDLSNNTAIQGVMLEGNQMDATSINAVFSVLPDVSSVEIHENNEEWARKINVSYMPGTVGVNAVVAESKGWEVIAHKKGTGVDEKLEIKESIVFCSNSCMLIASRQMEEICVYTPQGDLVKAGKHVDFLNVENLPAGIYVVCAVAYDGQKCKCKFLR